MSDELFERDAQALAAFMDANFDESSAPDLGSPTPLPDRAALPDTAPLPDPTPLRARKPQPRKKPSSHACSKCQASFPDLAALKKHLETHSLWLCIDPSHAPRLNPFENKSSYIRHMRTTHQQPTCGKCAASFPDMESLQTHVQAAYGQWLCIIPGCDKNKPFHDQSDYDKHMMDAHHIDENDESDECDESDESTDESEQSERATATSPDITTGANREQNSQENDAPGVRNPSAGHSHTGAGHKRKGQTDEADQAQASGGAGTLDRALKRTKLDDEEDNHEAARVSVSTSSLFGMKQKHRKLEQENMRLANRIKEMEADLQKEDSRQPPGNVSVSAEYLKTLEQENARIDGLVHENTRLTEKTSHLEQQYTSLGQELTRVQQETARLMQVNTRLEALEQENDRLKALCHGLLSELSAHKAQHALDIAEAREKRLNDKEEMTRRHQKELEDVAVNQGQVKRQHDHLDEMRREWREVHDEEYAKEKQRNLHWEKNVAGMLDKKIDGQGDEVQEDREN